MVLVEKDTSEAIQSMAGVIRSINLAKNVSVRDLFPWEATDTYKSLKRKRGRGAGQWAGLPQDRIRQAVDPINLDYREVQTRGGETPMDQSGIRRRRRRRRMNRRQRTYKSRRLTRTKATLARDNPAGLTRENVLFFFVIFRVDIYYEGGFASSDMAFKNSAHKSQN